jgi:transglutaminase-like putative cysteine protease
MFLRISHLSRYDYSEAVSFAPHELYLRPADSPRQRLHQFTLTITPEARRIATSDPLDNAVDWAYFPATAVAPRLEFLSDLLVETLEPNPFAFFLRPAAATFPFAYQPVEAIALDPCLITRSDTPVAELRTWLAKEFSAPPTETVALLVQLVAAVHRCIRYMRRDEEGIQSVAETLRLGSGSCRDQAVFLMEALRLLGLAARFVSGYIYEPPATGAGPAPPPAMHAWTEVYLPGAGWRGLDPSRGIFCDDAFVAVAHAAVAESVSPIQGTFIGTPGVKSSLTTDLKINRL